MATAPKFSARAVSTKADALLALADGGALRIYDGAKPATADTPLTDQVCLAELRFGTPAFAAAVAGEADAHALTPEASAPATGTATWFRVLTRDGLTALFDGTVGTVNADLILNSVAIEAGAELAVTAFVYIEVSGG